MANKKTSIGGQALIEGIMMRGPEKTAMAVRNAKNDIILEKWENSTKVPKIAKIPIIRGVYGMVSSLTLGYKCLMRSADISLADAEEEIRSEEEKNKEAVSQSPDATESTDESDLSSNEAPAVEQEEAPVSSSEAAEAEDTKDSYKTEKNESTTENKALLTLVMVVGMTLGIALAIFLFILLPTLVSKLIVGGDTEAMTSSRALLRSVIEGVMKIVILVLYMWAVSFMKDIKRTFMYHGAEHKTIFCYEQGLELTVENVRKQRRFHPRCGTSFLVLMLLVGMLISFFIDPIFYLTLGYLPHVAIRALIKLILLPITMGVGYEIIKIAGRHDNVFTRIVSAPGLWLQRVTVLEPTDDMIECAIMAMNEVIPEDSEKDNW